MSGDMVLEWNSVAMEAAAADSSALVPSQGGPTRTARALAIVHAAIFDAANSIDRSYTPYLVRMRAPRRASIEAAVALAGHDTLVALYPHQKFKFDEALEKSLAEVPNGRSERQGAFVGRFVARKILAARKHDGSEKGPAYTALLQPGVFRTFLGEPVALTPGWGKVKPFVMKSGDQFEMPAPPVMTGAEYAAAYNEVKDLGGDGIITPTLRTPEQTEIGIYWAYDGTPGLGTPPRLYNQITQVIARQEGNTPVQNARLFALVNIAMADAGIASWETKYHYDFWRPFRAIRQFDEHGLVMDDGNPLTTADASWTPLGAPCTNCPPLSTGFTPPFPAYTSGHATFGAALFETLTRFYGRDDIPFTFVSDEFNGVNRAATGVVRPLKPRSFSSFSRAMEENGESRIYLGIHWRFDKEQGIIQGKVIADYVFEHMLTPLMASGVTAGRTVTRR